MKKIAVILAALTTAAVAFTGCGSNSSKDIDKNLVGTWYSDDLGGCLEFGSNGIVSMSSDYSEMDMFFNEDMNFEISGVEVTPDYDGSTLSVVVGEDFGLDEDMEFFTLERTGKADEDSLDGEYKLVSGELYDELEDIYGEEEGAPDTYMTIDGESFVVTIEVCEYKADGSQISFSGAGITFFDFEDEEDAVATYEVDGDTLNFTVDDETLELTKQ